MSLVRADAISIPLRDESVDLVVTSPPYFSLRSYTDHGEHYDGQIGSEPTPQDFLEALWAVTRECRRVLKPSGSMWVNLGDKYAGSAGWCNSEASAASSKLKGNQQRTNAHAKPKPPITDIRPKSLMGLPWRYAIGCIDDLDLILRAEVIWSKPNGLPESVTDRVRRSHEQWFHLTKEPRYFAAVDEVREAHATEGGKSYADRLRDGQVNTKAKGNRGLDAGSVGMPSFARSPLGKLPGSVWTIPSEPLKVPDWLGVDHFAAFPQEWPRRIILGWSPSGICTACGQGRRPVVDVEYQTVGRRKSNVRVTGLEADGTYGKGRPGGADAPRGDANRLTTITGYACDCPTPTAPTRPAVVLDPFGGTGTTAMVARALGRFGVSMDLSRDYLRLAQWRVFESGHWMKTVTRTHGQQNDKGEWKRPPKREMVKGTMVKVDDGTARCWECGWSAPTRSVRHGEALARTHGCQS